MKQCKKITACALIFIMVVNMIMSNFADMVNSESEVITYIDDDLELLRSYASLNKEEGVLQLNSAESLVILSNYNPEIYQNWTISISYTGAMLNVPASVEASPGTSYNFKGFGDEAHPFAGKWNISALVAPRTVFNYLSTDAKLNYDDGADANNVSIYCQAPDQMGTRKYAMDSYAVIADNLIISDEGTYTYNINTYNANYTNAYAGLFGRISGQNGKLVIKSDLSSIKVEENEAITGKVNAGLICNTLENGSLNLSMVTLPAEWSVEALTGNAGGLIGLAEAGTAVIGPSVINGATVNAKADAGYAGGLVGLARADVSLILSGDISIAPKLNSKNGSGGIAGYASDIVIEDGEHVLSSLAIEGGSIVSTSESAGGLFGELLITKASGNLAGFNQRFSVNNCEIKATSASAGGLVGVLTYGLAAGNLVIAGQEENYISLGSKGPNLIAGSNGGGLFGTYIPKDLKATLNLSRIDAATKLSSDTLYYGGLIGAVTSGYSNAYIEADDILVRMNRNNKAVNKCYGGLIAESQTGHFINLGNFTFVADDGMGGVTYGGIIGNMWSGVLRLHGTSNLADAKATDAGPTKGQIVGSRGNALIYGMGSGADEGWTLERSQSVRVSDVGNYGTVYRNNGDLELEGEGGVLDVDWTNHTVTVKAPETAGTINSVNDFAAYAMLVQYNKKNVGALRWSPTWPDTSNFYRDTLTLGNDIDLSGTGLTGLWRDNGIAEDSQLSVGFQGILEGNNHTINLATGQAYGKRNGLLVTNETEGSGQIYYHSHLGLFSVAQNAAIRNLNITGSMDFGADAAGQAGGLIGANLNGKVTIDGCRSDVDFTYSGDGVFYVGGLVGSVGDTGAITTGTISINNVAVSGNISHNMVDTSSPANSYIGGVIALRQSKLDTTVLFKSPAVIELNNVSINGLAISTEAITSTGGLLGYEWQNVKVVIRNLEVGKDADDKPSSLINKGSANFGGLIYQATGYWNVMKEAGKPGITINAASFLGNANNNNCTDGLLIYKGIRDTNYGLFLEIGDGAYVIGDEVSVVETNATRFDELVGITTTDNNAGANGQSVVSIATEGNKKIDVNSSNTYKNKTTNKGTAWKPNPYARYYYNLDTIRTSAASSKTISDAKQLLCWSVAKYSANNIKGYFGTASSEIVLADDVYDLEGLSYYPISINQDENITIDGNGAKIVFHNAEIEKYEKSSSDNIIKSTRTTNTKTQHYLMHFGLFYNYTTSSEPDESKRYTLSVNDLKLSGSIGVTQSNYSGALICGTVEGKVNKASSSVITTHAINVSGLMLDSLYVDGRASDTAYAPLLVNKIGSYTAFSSYGSGIKGSYSKLDASMPDTAASSLIGDVGSNTAEAINLSFVSLKLQDSSNPMFSRAMILNSFRYAEGKVADAVYNFNYSDDWTANAYNHNNVTYGKEISESVEYEGLQTQYNKSDIFTGKSGSKESFAGYLPYVYIKYKGTSGTDNTYHEIKVNIQVVDIIEGCGTYGHPYAISSAKELVTVADYLAGGSARTGWKIRMAPYGEEGSGITLHVEGEEGCDVYVFDGANWMDEATGKIAVKDALVREYLRNAFYQITEDITLGSNFRGLGYDERHAFRGVIVGKEKEDGSFTSVTLLASALTTNTKAHGLINYSYGSVLKDLNIILSAKDEKDRDLSATISETARTEATVGQFFGGLIGQVLGGDNFIDNVNVSTDENYITLSGDYDKLTPIGGYIGIIQGGAVIFRNVGNSVGVYPAGDKGDAYFYINPVIGRVLDGCAFNEDQSNNLDNGDKNYKISRIDPNAEKGISAVPGHKLAASFPTDASQVFYMNVTAKDAQGLLIMSAIVNSGAAGGADVTTNQKGTFAYYEKYNTYFGNQDYGKSRNATYAYIGTKESPEDFAKAKKDDFKLVTYSGTTSDGMTEDSNAPYLVTNYCESRIMFYYCSGQTRMNLSLAPNEYDMSVYGTGYRAIGAIYKSKAAQTSTTTDVTKQYNVDRVSPFIVNIYGNGCELKLERNVEEYAEDNYHVMAVGGLLNVMQQESQAATATKKGTRKINGGTITLDDTVSDITVTGNLSLRYYTITTGEEVYSSINYYTNNSDTDNNKAFAAGVGGLIGKSANRAFSNKPYYYCDFKNINVSELKVHAPYNAGGIIGLGGVNVYTVSTVKHSENGENVYAAHFTNCSIKDSVIEAGYNAGGFAGWITENVNSATSKNSTSGKGNEYVNMLVDCNASDSTIRTLSTISSTSLFPKAGAFFGISDVSNKVQNVTVSNVNVYADKGYAGTLAGRVATGYDGHTTQIDGMKVLGTEEDKGVISAQLVAGGIIGHTNRATYLNDVGVYNVNIKSNIAGGLVGSAESCKVDINSSIVTNIRFSTYAVGTFKNTDATPNITTTGKGLVAGGLVGFLNNNVATILTGDNILWEDNYQDDENKFEYITNLGKTNESHFYRIGTWAGYFNTNNTIQLIGVSRKLTDSSAPLFPEVASQVNIKYGTIPSAYTGSGYIVYSDYTVDNNNPNPGLAPGKEPLNKVNVSTSPNGQYVSGNPFIVGGMQLYGDAVTNLSEGRTNVNTIYEERKNSSSTDGRVPYFSANVENFYFEKYISLYSTQQLNSPQEVKFSEDFAVLLLSGNVNETITNYLNIITNGGYSKAANSGIEGAVSASAATYKWNGSSFVKMAGSSLTVKGLNYSMSRAYDNDNDQFTLLTVTFKAGDHNHIVYVPMVVRRMVEIDFLATFTEGGVFRADVFNDLENHVLENFDTAITAYLTWKYNSSLGEFIEYDWKSYLEAGADLTKAFNKTLKFEYSGGYMPIGTQLALIDEANRDKTYFYTITEADVPKKDGEGMLISLDRFTDLSGQAYSQEAISKVLNAEVSPSADGLFVKAENLAEATIITRDGDLYRLAISDVTDPNYQADKEKDHFMATISQGASAKENFYLAVIVPSADAKEADIIKVNGALNTIVSLDVPSNVTVIRRRSGLLDRQVDTESTFSICSSYLQTLSDNSTDSTPKNLSSIYKNINIDVLDTVTFDVTQSYKESDLLYHEFVITPHQVDSVGGLRENTKYFLDDIGTSARVNFYVYYKDTKGLYHYYQYQDGSLADVGQVPAICITQDWTSKNGPMTLVLGDGNQSIELSKIRQDIILSLKDVKVDGKDVTQGKFYIEAKANIELSDVSFKELIMVSGLDATNRPYNYTRFQYGARLSKTEDFQSSMWRGNVQGSHSYYQNENGHASFSFDADNINQLGINLSDLTSKESQIINATATFDVSKWTGVENVLKHTDRVRFTMVFKQKQADGSYKELNNADEYIDYMIVTQAFKDGSIVPKALDYIKDSSGKGYWIWDDVNSSTSGAVFANYSEGESFSLPVEFAVKTDTNQANFNYANYRIEMKVELLAKTGENTFVNQPILTGKDNESVENMSDYITYTFARISTNYLNHS